MFGRERPRADLNLEDLAERAKGVRELFDGFSRIAQRKGQMVNLFGCCLPFGPRFFSFEIDIPVNDEPIHLIVRQRIANRPEKMSLVVNIGQVIDGRKVGLFLRPKGEAHWIYPSLYLQDTAKVIVPKSEELEPYREILQRLSV